MRCKFRCTFASAVAMVILAWVAPFAVAQAKARFDLPTQPLADSLRAVGSQTSLNILFDPPLVAAHQAPALKGEFTTSQAFALLLAGTGINHEFLNERTVVLAPREAEAAITPGAGAPNVTKSPERGPAISISSAARFQEVDADLVGKSFWTRFRLAQAETNSAPDTFPNSSKSDSSSEESDKRSVKLEEILVTAQKRKQDVQVVPIAITAITGEALEDRGIRDAIDLQSQVPSMEVHNVGNSVIVTMRGITAPNPQVGGDPGVTLYVDGHYLQNVASLVEGYLDLNRIEVLRGPQGTFAGRNSIAGSMNLITNRPTETFEGSLELDMGNYDKRRITGVVSGPFTDSARGRLAIQNEDRDGYVENDAGSDLFNSQYTVARGALELDVADNAQVLLTAYNLEDQSDRYVQQFVTDDPRRINQDGPFINFHNAGGASVDFEWIPQGGLTFRSLTAYNDVEFYGLQDTGDASTPATIVQNGSTRTITQEFQLLSPDDGSFSWILGAYYYDEASDFFFGVDNDVADVHLGVGPAAVTASSAAVFAQGALRFAPGWELTAGIRDTYDEKSMLRSLLFLEVGGVVIAPGGQEPERKDDWDAITGNVSLTYSPSENIMLYASGSRGYRAGGYNWNSTDTPSYDPEYADNYELGVRSDWLDNRLRLNLTAFHMEETDRQEFAQASLAQGAFYIINAAEVRVDGIELEGSAEPTRGLTLNWTLSWLDSEYVDFTTFDRPSNSFVDLSGVPTMFTPEWKASLGVTYEWTLGKRGTLAARIDTSFTDERLAGVTTTVGLPSYRRTNGQITWESPGGAWLVDVYGTNLEDDNVPSLLFGNVRLYFPPLFYGVRLKREF